MEMFEKVEKITEKTGVTYEEAREALLNNNEDMLDAIIYLERAGKVKKESGSYKTNCDEGSRSAEFDNAQATYEKMCEDKKADSVFKKFGQKLSEIFRAGLDTTFTVRRNGNEIITIPVLFVVLLLIFAFWVTIPLLIVGLFFDCRYSFQGIPEVNVDLNGMCNKAADICNDIKDDVVNKKGE